jgi:hypothetical protein
MFLSKLTQSLGTIGFIYLDRTVTDAHTPVPGISNAYGAVLALTHA